MAQIFTSSPVRRTFSIPLMSVEDKENKETMKQ